MTGVVDSLAELAGLAHRLRVAGLTVDMARVAVAAQALHHLKPIGRDAVYWGTRLSLCSRVADLAVFDVVFETWFEGRASARDGGPATARAAADTPQPPDVDRGDLVSAGRPVGSGGLVDAAGSARLVAPRGIGAAAMVPLIRRDLRELTPDEHAEVETLIALIGRAGRTRRTMRYQAGGRRRIDQARTVRTMLRGGGELVALRFRRRAVKPRRLVLLVDVSESMQPYSEALLRFAHAAVSARPAVTETFTLGIRCTRITPALRMRDTEAALAQAVGAESGWGGGTLLGRTLRDLMRSRDGCNAVRSATVVIASDGHDSGPAALLVDQVGRLSRLAYQLIWVNPQQGWPGYRPMAPGLVASLRFVDRTMPGHSFEALRELAELITRD